ncbi:hypothetical protein IGI39_001081 [Enterococcus sp. AZ135]|uniref:hypothetical protein n=1 Tax=unclassified Enterococcus TaxID=2608891 RepID=UPI003F2263F9
MEAKQLTRRQIFTMKRTSLETKMHKFWQESQNVDLFVEYIVAILLRNALVVSDFSLPCQELVRELLFQAEPSDTLRNLCPFLKDYVNEQEWHTIIKRLYKNETKYFKATKKTRLYDSYLKNRGTAKPADTYDSYLLVSIFEDANGKKHTWKLRDADPKNTLEEAKRMLRILTILTIFHNKAEVRSFAKFLDCECTGTTTIFSSKSPKKETQKTSAQTTAVESVKHENDLKDELNLAASFDLHSLTKGDLIVLIEKILAEAATVLDDEVFSDSNEENAEKLSPNRTIGQQTDLDSRIVPAAVDKKESHQFSEATTKVSPESNLIPSSASAAPVAEKETEKQAPSMNHPAAKKKNKYYRHILDNFNSRKKKK